MTLNNLRVSQFFFDNNLHDAQKIFDDLTTKFDWKEENYYEKILNEISDTALDDVIKPMILCTNSTLHYEPKELDMMKLYSKVKKVVSRKVDMTENDRKEMRARLLQAEKKLPHWERSYSGTPVDQAMMKYANSIFDS